MSTGRFNTHEGESSEDHAWSLDRRTIEAHLERLRSEPKFTELFGEEARTAGRRIAALVPVCSSTGSRLATVVIGRKPLFPLADSECSLIVAAVGMATLLLEQVRVRDMLRVAEAQAETVKRLVESRRRVMFGQN